MTLSGTISTVRSKIWSSTPPIEDCGTGTSIICTGTKDSMIGSTVRRRTRACEPATSGRGGGRRRTRSPCHWLSSGPVGRCTALAPPTPPSTGQNGTRSGGAFQPGPLRRSSRSCRSIERRRRSLLHLAEPVETRSAQEPSAGITTAMPMSTQPYDLIGNPGAESPGSKLPATPAPLEPSSTHSCECSKARKNWRSTPGQPEEREK